MKCCSFSGQNTAFSFKGSTLRPDSSGRLVLYKCQHQQPIVNTYFRFNRKNSCDEIPMNHTSKTNMIKSWELHPLVPNRTSPALEIRIIPKHMKST